MLVDTSYAERGPSGTGTYIERLVAALRAGGEVDVVEPPPRRRLRPGRAGRRWNPARSAANALLDAVWVQVALPRAARGARADVLHHPLPARSRRSPCAQVVTVHDLAFERLPGRYGAGWRALAGRSNRAAARAAGAVICVSEATAGDVATRLGVAREHIVIARHGPGQELPAARPTEPSHFLYVGDAEPRKDLEGLLAAYADYRSHAADPLGLVLAGASAESAAGDGVSGERSPDARRLADLLAAAAALVHPSLDEGFGLTLLEAMAAGTPVVAVRNPGTAEVCGDAALLVGPGELTGALERIAGDAAARAELAERGRERAGRFTWAESARLHGRAYNLAAQSYGRVVS